MKKDEVIESIARLARKVGADPELIPTFENPDYNGRPNIEFLGRYYQYSIQEGNTELKRMLCTDLDGLLYEIFKDVTSEMASRYELAHRTPGVDFRRLQFSKQLELLEILNSDWSQRVQKDQLSILKVAPLRTEACSPVYPKSGKIA